MPVTTSGVPCVIIASNSTLSCGAANTMGTIFGQTEDGESTHTNSETLYAAATASGTMQKLLTATQAAVAVNAVWKAL